MKFLIFIPIFLFSYCQGWAETSFNQEIKPIIQVIEEMVTTKKTKGIYPVVAIGGCPEVGKTTFAKLLQHQLSEMGITSLILSLDHYKVSQKKESSLNIH